MTQRDVNTKSVLFQKMLKEAPTWEADFTEFCSEYQQLCERDHSFAGRLVTCHLLLEHFMTDYLEAAYPTMPELSEARLTFSQKLRLAAYERTNVFLFQDAIHSLNSLRNKLVHDIRFVPSTNDLSGIRTIMGAWNSAVGKPLKDGIDLVEEMTAMVCMMFAGSAKQIRRRHRKDGIIGLLRWWSDDSDSTEE